MLLASLYGCFVIFVQSPPQAQQTKNYFLKFYLVSGSASASHEDPIRGTTSQHKPLDRFW